jgi:hypothetical protein
MMDPPYSNSCSDARTIDKILRESEAIIRRKEFIKKKCNGRKNKPKRKRGCG